MKIFEILLDRISIIGELGRFLWKRKLWWLIPLVFILILFGILMVIIEVTGAGAFIYTLF